MMNGWATVSHDRCSTSCSAARRPDRSPSR
jgi:hypothetical protein